MKDCGKPVAGGQRIALFDYLKAFFIILVIVTHYSWTDVERLNIVFPFIVSMAIPGFMIISGYVLFLSGEKKYQTGLADLYALEVLFARYMRFTIPFLIALTVEIIFQIINQADVTFASSVHLYLVGGKGPGSYYYPLMIQLIFVFPLIYWIMKRGPIKGLIIVGVLNLSYEIMIHAYGMSWDCYRLLIFRYLLLIGFGCYLYLMKDKRLKLSVLLIMMLIGSAYIVVTKYTGYEEVLFTYWTSTSMMTAFWVFPLFYFVFKLCGKARPSKIQIIGRASYHIFLFQMVYYAYADKIVLGYLPDIAAGHVIFNIVLCISGGVVFYLFENKLNKLVLRYLLTFLKNIKIKYSLKP